MIDIKRIPIKLELKEFIITFEYETKRNNRRTDKRTIKHLNIEDAKQSFKEWSIDSRTIFNAKILNIVETNNIKIVEV